MTMTIPATGAALKAVRERGGLTQADRLLALYHGAWGGDAGRALLHAEV